MNVEKLGSEILRLVADALEEKEPLGREGAEQIWERMKAQAKTRAATYERPKFEDTNEVDELRKSHAATVRALKASRVHVRIERDKLRLERDRLAAELKKLRTENATHFLQRNELLTAARAVLAPRCSIPAVVELRAVVERIDKS